MHSNSESVAQKAGINLRLFITGDTHENQAAISILRQASADFDHVLYTGDCFHDAPFIRKDAIAVCGNVDGVRCKQQELVIGGIEPRLLLVHGHQYKVKSGLDHLLEYAKKRNVQLVVFGHTHIPECRLLDGKLFLNPGSASLPRGGYPATYAVLEIVKKEGYQISVSHFELSGKVLDGFSQSHTISQ